MPQTVENIGKKPITSVSTSSQQIADDPVPKVVRKKRAETLHEVSSLSFSFHSAVPDCAFRTHALLLALASQGCVRRRCVQHRSTTC